MKSLFLLAIWAGMGTGWASTETWHIGLLPGNHPALKISAEHYDVPAVITSSGGIITLSEFVESGKFCEARGGHRFPSSYSYYSSDPCKNAKCPVCGICKSKVKRTKEDEDFEP